MEPTSSGESIPRAICCELQTLIGIQGVELQSHICYLVPWLVGELLTASNVLSLSEMSGPVGKVCLGRVSLKGGSLESGMVSCSSCGAGHGAQLAKGCAAEWSYGRIHLSLSFLIFFVESCILEPCD